MSDDVTLEEERREELQAELPTDADELSIDDLDLSSLEYDDSDPCSCSSNSNSILQEAATNALREAEFISDIAAKCRVELCELLLKADLEKDKVKDRVKALQDFIVASDTRTDELTERVERLIKN